MKKKRDREKPKTKDKSEKRSGERSKSDEMRKLHEAWRKQEEGEDDDGADESRDKLVKGKNVRRALPNKREGEPFFEQWFMHYNLGPDGDESARCIEPGGAVGVSKKDKRKHAKKCPGCKRWLRLKKTANTKYEFGSKAGKQAYSAACEFRGKHRFVFAVTRPKSDDPDKVLLLETGPMIMQPLLAAYYDKDQGGDFTDPETGRDIIIKKIELGGGSFNVDYKANPAAEASRLRNWKRIKKNLPDLAEHIPEELSEKDFIALMEGDGDDDDDDKPRSKKRRGNNNSKKGRDNDEADDEDDEDEEDEEGDRKRSRSRSTADDDDVPDVDEDEEDDDDDSEDDDEDDDADSEDDDDADADDDDSEDDDDDGDSDGDDDSEDDDDDDEGSEDDDDDEDEESEDDDDDDDEDDDDEDEKEERRVKRKGKKSTQKRSKKGRR